MVYQDFRRVLLRRFPNTHHFRIEQRMAVVFLLTHGARRVRSSELCAGGGVNRRMDDFAHNATIF